MPGRIYFISDAHLGAPSLLSTQPEREARLISFLHRIRQDAEALYIVGDLFDFWFEYRSAVPATGARVLFELHHTVRSGVRVVCMPGNHDLWLGPYLRDEVGLELPSDPVSLEAQGKRVYITHGDSFRGDAGFHISRGILNNRLCIALFRLLHPDIGVWLAGRVSGFSETRMRDPARGRRTFIRGATEKVAEGYDVVVCGHYHLGIREPIGAGTLVVLGDWERAGSYAVLESGEVTLHTW